MKNTNEIRVSPFHVTYKGRILKTGNHDNDNGRLRELYLQQAIVYGQRFVDLWQKIIDLNEFSKCSRDTQQLLHDVYTGDAAITRPKHSPERPMSETILKQMQINQAYQEAIESGKAAEEAKRYKGWGTKTAAIKIIAADFGMSPASVRQNLKAYADLLELNKEDY